MYKYYNIRLIFSVKPEMGFPLTAVDRNDFSTSASICCFLPETGL